jgi:23S rRNA (cytosine1962-C5)-methyltransferase
MVTREPEQPNREFWAERARRAVRARERAGLLEPAGACRLLAGDADGFPGMVVDRYRDVLVLQSGCQGSDAMRDFIVELLLDALPLEIGAILDRSDTSVRRLEELEPRVEWLKGEPHEAVEVLEEGMAYEVNPTGGHKTGAYLDQRANRIDAASRAKGARVLEACSYDGLFSVRAAMNGAEAVVALDQSADAGARFMRNAEANAVADRVRFERADVMGDLRRRQDEGERHDLVFLDPPAFARNRRELEGARRGYRELNLRAMSIVEPGGTLVTSSCSFAMTRKDFLEVLGKAARDARRDVFVEEFRGASPDHPWLVTLPESSYLKCAFLRVE